jgi:hypothetical protein
MQVEMHNPAAFRVMEMAPEQRAAEGAALPGSDELGVPEMKALSGARQRLVIQAAHVWVMS